MKLYMVLNKCGEGVVFSDEEDALSAISGRFIGMYSALAEAFHEAYEDDNRLIDIEIEDPAVVTP